MGFGFIVQDDGGPDLFVHRSETVGGGFLKGNATEKPKATSVSGGTGGESWGRPGRGGGKGYGDGGVLVEVATASVADLVEAARVVSVVEGAVTSRFWTHLP